MCIHYRKNLWKSMIYEYFTFHPYTLTYLHIIRKHNTKLIIQIREKHNYLGN